MKNCECNCFSCSRGHQDSEDTYPSPKDISGVYPGKYRVNKPSKEKGNTWVMVCTDE